MIKTVYEKLLTRAKKAIKHCDLMELLRLKGEVITAQSLGAITFDYLKLINDDIETIDTFTQVR